jgi:hypothetical protein
MTSKQSVKVELSINKMLSLKSTFDQLDAYEKVVGERTVSSPYSFSGETYLAIARNQNRLKAAHREFDEAREKLVKKHLPEGKSSITPNDDPAEFAAFQKDYEEFVQAPVELELFPIKEKDLRLGGGKDENPIRPTILGPLLEYGLLTEDDSPPSAM